MIKRRVIRVLSNTIFFSSHTKLPYTKHAPLWNKTSQKNTLVLKKTMDENGNTIIKTKPRTGARRVLVTGGAGFVGSHLCDALVAVRENSFVFSSLLLHQNFSPSSIERCDKNNKFPRRALTTFFPFFRALKQRGDYVICMGTRFVHRFVSIVAPSACIFRARASAFFCSRRRRRRSFDAGL